MSETDALLIDEGGPVVTVTMNRPKALNALTTEMCAALDAKLQAWATDPTVQAVVLQGAGDKAFCAGGDVRALWDAGKDIYHQDSPDLTAAARFFGTEYAMNRRIQMFPKPYIALIDGICMGGGFGISVHGSHRICTEKAMFAMPETGIGLFPDVGGTSVLPNCPGETGTFLGLTGARLGAADMIWAGIGSHFVATDRLADFVAALQAADWQDAEDPHDVVDDVLSGFAGDPGRSGLHGQQAEIDSHFSGPTVEAILASLESSDSAFAQDTAKTLGRMSPSSLKVTLKALREAPADFTAVMQREYNIVMGCMRHHDFYEGIRAVLVDKDRNPQWQPASLDAVDAARVEDYFRPADPPLTFAD